jgi:hypothetical protein
MGEYAWGRLEIHSHLTGKAEVWILLGRCKQKWEDNMNMNLKEMV